MKNTILILIIVLVLGVIVVLGYLIMKKSPTVVYTPEETIQTSAATPTATESPQQTPIAEESSTVTIENLTFSPSTLTVKKGTTVSWINNDSVVHNIKSDKFNSQNFNNGEKFEFQFNEVGTFDYSCGIHPSMKGTIIVE